MPIAVLVTVNGKTEPPGCLGALAALGIGKSVHCGIPCEVRGPRPPVSGVGLGGLGGEDFGNVRVKERAAGAVLAGVAEPIYAGHEGGPALGRDVGYKADMLANVALGEPVFRAIAESEFRPVY